MRISHYMTIIQSKMWILVLSLGFITTFNRYGLSKGLWHPAAAVPMIGSVLMTLLMSSYLDSYPNNKIAFVYACYALADDVYHRAKHIMLSIIIPAQGALCAALAATFYLDGIDHIYFGFAILAVLCKLVDYRVHQLQL